MAMNFTILSGGAMRPLLTEAVPLFERAHGVRAEVRFALTSVLAKEIEQGAAFDIALLPRPELDALAASCAIAPGTQTDIARSAVGLAVRQGATKPDISTVEALTRTLLAARTIVTAMARAARMWPNCCSAWALPRRRGPGPG
jgi:molybdate transport system substrate-binding protein